MTEADKLLALAECVEALTEPDREVDGRIAKAIGMNFGFCGDEGWICAACSMGIDTTQFPECGAPLGLHDERTSYPSYWRDDERLPRYTASLDAALSLVPEGYEWALDYCLGSSAVMGRKCQGPYYMARASAPTIALTAAALRARAEALK